MRKLIHCFTALVLVLSICCATAISQTDDAETLAELQQQIIDLREELKETTNAAQDQESQSKSKSNNRVREVGRQIVNRKPRGSYEEEVSLQIRLYDLSDLFAVSPNYPAVAPNELQAGQRMFSAAHSAQQRGGSGGFGGGQGGGGGGVFNIPPRAGLAAPQESHNLNMQAAQVTLHQLVETLKETVKPEMWGNSSTSARIKFLGNTLLITASEEMHTQINQLLNLFREHWGKRRTVSIQTWWIRADHGVADALLDQKTTETIGAGVVANERWKEFFDKAREEKRTVYSATLTGHNNQTLHALSGREVRLTIDAKPYKTSDMQWHVKDMDDLESEATSIKSKDDNFGLVGQKQRIVGFHPLDAVFHDGAVIELTPLATRGGNFVILDLQAKLNTLIGGDRNESVFVENEGERIEVQLDDIDYVTSRFSSTLRCPKDQIVLAGSMTRSPNAESDSPELLVFVRASVHTIEEDQSDWKKSTLLPDNAAAGAEEPQP